MSQAWLVFYFLLPLEMETTLLRHKAIEAKVLLRSGLTEPDVLIEALQIPMTKFRMARFWIRNNRHCGVCQQNWTSCELSRDQIKRLIRVLKTVRKELR